MNVLILYYELAAYNFSCFKALLDQGVDELHVVSLPINKEAPFQFDDLPGLHLHARQDLDKESLRALVDEVKPQIIFCGGWNDKDYLDIVTQNPKVISMLAFDNWWTGSLKQRVGALVKGRTFSRMFNHAFVPGQPQVQFAKKLGFSQERILKGVYSADYDLFHQQYLTNLPAKQEALPHRFLYVGRYVQHKGIFDMWEAFRQLKQEVPNDWELWCLGTGDQYDCRVESTGIRHFGFVQPAEMAEYIAKTTCYILPSHFEPWGVSAHEMAAAGMPMLLSDQIGAGSQFLRDGENGYTFPSGDVGAIKDRMRRIIEASQEELLAMGDKSAELAASITPETWARTFLGTIGKGAS